MKITKSNILQISIRKNSIVQVADPGFPRGTPRPKGGRQPIIWSNFPENCMKMEKLDRGRVQLLLRMSATGLRVLRLLTDEAVRLFGIHRVEVALVPHVLRRLPAALLPPQPLFDDVAPVLSAPWLSVLGIPL